MSTKTKATYCIGHRIVINRTTDTWTCACGAQGNMPVHGHQPGKDDRDAN